MNVWSSFVETWKTEDWSIKGLRFRTLPPTTKNLRKKKKGRKTQNKKKETKKRGSLSLSFFLFGKFFFSFFYLSSLPFWKKSTSTKGFPWSFVNDGDSRKDRSEPKQKISLEKEKKKDFCSNFSALFVLSVGSFFFFFSFSPFCGSVFFFLSFFKNGCFSFFLKN